MTITTVSGLADFRDPQILFSSKGTKLQFKASETRPSLGSAMEYFESFLDYNSVKEIYDANKCLPFANDAIEELAPDPSIRNATRNIFGSDRQDARTVEVGYLIRKQRTSHALRDARQKSYGIREEHRVTWAVPRLT
jgi:hypothetical protein